MPEDVNEAIAGATPVLIITDSEGNDAQANAMAPASSEAEAAPAVAAVDPASPQDGSLTPAIAAVAEATPHEPIAPNWFQHIEVEGMACVQHIYDFGKGLGAEVVEFIKRGRHRVTPIAFKGVEINNFDHVGPSVVHATPELAQLHLADIKEGAVHG